MFFLISTTVVDFSLNLVLVKQWYARINDLLPKLAQLLSKRAFSAAQQSMEVKNLNADYSVVAVKFDGYVWAKLNARFLITFDKHDM